jgi:hypothetical protein
MITKQTPLEAAALREATRIRIRPQPRPLQSLAHAFGTACITVTLGWVLFQVWAFVVVADLGRLVFIAAAAAVGAFMLVCGLVVLFASGLSSMRSQEEERNGDNE